MTLVSGKHCRKPGMQACCREDRLLISCRHRASARSCEYICKLNWSSGMHAVRAGSAAVPCRGRLPGLRL